MHNNTDNILSIILYYTVLYKNTKKYSSIIEKYSILRTPADDGQSARYVRMEHCVRI